MDTLMRETLRALRGGTASTPDVVREKRAATKRALESAERQEEAAISKAAELRAQDKLEEEAERRYFEEFEHNPNAIPDPCLEPDDDLVKQARERGIRKARAKYLCLYAIYVLGFNQLDGYDQKIDVFGPLSERIALMYLLARLGYQIVFLNSAKREVLIRRCSDGECETGHLLFDFASPEVDRLPPVIMQEIKQPAAVRLDVKLAYRTDGTYGPVGTNNRVTPILPYFPIRFQQPERFSDIATRQDGQFYDYPKDFYNYVYPRHPP
jgi:hypothetical protein